MNWRKGRLESMRKVLEVDGAVARDRGKWWRTPEEWAYDQGRVSSVTAVRRAEQQAMRDYAATDKCLMEFLRLQLDDPEAAPCGRCANCTGEQPAVVLDRQMVGRALARLRGADRLMESRETGS